MSNLNKEEMEEYRKSVLEYEDVQRAIKYTGERSFEEGEKRGEKRGEERLARLIVMRMLAQGFSVETICEVTGLTEKEVGEIVAKSKE